MAVYSPVSKKELELFLKRYNIGYLIKFDGILEGIENTNYKIQTSENDYILTIFEKRVDHSDLPFFINLKKHLYKKKFNCPQPIKDIDGNYINLIQNKHCLIISFLKGKKISIVENIHCKQVGEMLAIFHENAKDFDQKRDNTMSYNQWEVVFKKIQNRKNNKFSDMIPKINNELIYLATKWPKELPEGVIHADAFQDNIFFINHELSGLIDFYFACNDFFAYDLALTINAWCFDNKTSFKKEKFLQLITGYESKRPLIAIEKKYLSTLLRGASLRILLTRIHDYIFQPDGAYVKPKDPEEYYSILQFHQEYDLNELLK